MSRVGRRFGRVRRSRAARVVAGIVPALLASAGGARAAEPVTFASSPATDRAFELRVFGTAMKWGGNQEVVEVGLRSHLRFQPSAGGDKVRGSASRLIDPATLLVWREQLDRREEHEIRPLEEIGVTFAVEERLDTTLTPAGG